MPLHVTSQADESIIVLYGDNERLEEEVAKLRAAIAQYQSGGAVTVAVAPQDAESQNVEALAKKLRNAEEREVAANKRLEGQKERIAQISQQLAEVMAKQSSLAGEVDELRKDKEQLQKVRLTDRSLIVSLLTPSLFRNWMSIALL